MPYRIVADKLEDLPEGLRTEAKQEGQVFVVSQLGNGWALENVQGLKNAIAEERQTRKQLEKAVSAYEGLAPEAVAEAREALEKLKAGQLKGSKEIDEWKQSFEAKVRDERAKIEAKLAKRTEALRDRMVRGELAPVIAAKGGADAMDSILTLASQHIRFEETTDGEIRVSLVDKGGKPLLTKKQGSSDPMGFDELIDQMREAPATRGLFKASATGGSGGSSQIGGAGRAANQGQTNLSPRELFDRANAGTAAG